MLTVSPKSYLLSFLTAFKLNLMSGPRPHGHLEIPLFPSQGSVQKCLCFPQICQMSALSPLLFLEEITVLEFPCQMAVLSFPSAPLHCCSSHSLTLWLTSLATVCIRNPRELWSSSGFLEFLRPEFLLSHSCRRKIFVAYSSSVFEMFPNYLFLIKTCLL